MKTLALFAALTLSTAANALEGRATTTDGDTVVVNGISVRLKGVDAAESGTELGEEAARAMRLIASNWLRCELTGEVTHKRQVGYCVNAEGEDIGAAIVKQGLALACAHYSTRYVKLEHAAAVERQARASYCLRGSAKIATTAPRRATDTCDIKGNISRGGEHIYHMPNQQHYAVTVIDTSKGEQMFCSEADAIAAGWRKAMK